MVAFAQQGVADPAPEQMLFVCDAIGCSACRGRFARIEQEYRQRYFVILMDTGRPFYTIWIVRRTLSQWRRSGLLFPSEADDLWSQMLREVLS